jgi:hypothetical protein
MNLAALAELSATLALLSFVGWLLFSISQKPRKRRQP